MIYELRIYHCVVGRLPALLKRFESTTLELWQRHGIRQAGFWTVLVGEGGNQDLHYLLAWESLAERETKWNKFATDPEWLSKRFDHEHVSAADGVLGGEVKADRCPAVLIMWSMR
jgi:NIPSNAP